jgi:hypothetical protein
MYADISGTVLRPGCRRCIVGLAARNTLRATRGTHHPAAFAHICISIFAFAGESQLLHHCLPGSDLRHR